ncbi:4 -phosphopantetheinyl transferase superfamily [Lecanosticta acicola]|uniref:4 -phosphopantetheinyl transferase superfamily n=1 Tax=Lecanosticta acicola TaxID=111012 RepID=A0AAI8Z1M2_9PEZI|nr:4 -phosphopantetheinyl transferase superfamily [Lecanosticta acicola]
MPPKPFPLPFGIGTDIIRISRICDIIAKDSPLPSRNSTSLLPFLRRVLTQREQTDFWRRFKNEATVWSDKKKPAAEYLAGRWAAKEAVIKAVRYRPLTLLQVEIHRYPPVHERSGVFALILDQPADTMSAKTSQLGGHGPPSSSDARLEDRMAGHPLADNLQERSQPGDSEEIGSQQTAGAPSDPADPLYGGVPYDQLEGQIARISISHDGDYATAFCLAHDVPMEGDVGGEAAARMP